MITPQRDQYILVEDRLIKNISGTHDMRVLNPECYSSFEEAESMAKKSLVHPDQVVFVTKVVGKLSGHINVVVEKIGQ